RHGGGTGPRRLAADVEQVRAFLDHPQPVLDRDLRVEEIAAVRERVRRDVDDSGDPGPIEHQHSPGAIELRGDHGASAASNPSAKIRSSSGIETTAVLSPAAASGSAAETEKLATTGSAGSGRTVAVTANMTDAPAGSGSSWTQFSSVKA